MRHRIKHCNEKLGKLWNRPHEKQCTGVPTTGGLRTATTDVCQE